MSLRCKFSTMTPSPPSSPNQRAEFTRGTLRRREMAAQPLEQFRRWLQEAVDAEVPEPYATTLATVEPNGAPAARTILLKAVDDDGFVFTSSDSPKTRDMRKNPNVSLVFYWPALERQVRVSGQAEALSHEENLALYAVRPHDQRLALLTFPQSQPISSREMLEQRFEQLRQGHAGQHIELPQSWGGWRIVPKTVEFWQGGMNRLHDRICYSALNNESWSVERLAP